MKSTLPRIFLLLLTCSPLVCTFAQEPDGGAWFSSIVPEATTTTYDHGQEVFLNRKYWLHQGVDIVAKCGERILAPADGRIVEVMKEGHTHFGTLGNGVLIKHFIASDRKPIYTLYLHLQNEPIFQYGEVQRGDLLGHVGKTGKTLGSGCHLHYEVRTFEGVEPNKPLHKDVLNIYVPSKFPSRESILRDWANPEDWTRAFKALKSEAMTLRFAKSCGNSVYDEEVECPYVEQGTCVGESCRTSGLLELLEEAPLFRFPGSADIVEYGPKGSRYLIHSMRTYSVPCRGVVNAAGEPSARVHKGLRPGSTVHRLSYAGEGLHRYLQDGEVVVQRFDDEVEVVEDCTTRSEQWYEVTSPTGRPAWIRSGGALNRAFDESERR